MTERKKRHRTETGRSYGGVPIHAGPRVHEAVLDIVREKLSPGAHVADLGAGSGALSVRLQDHGYRVTALDSNTEGMAAGIDSVEIDVTDLSASVGEHVFDASLAVEVIEHVDSPVELLRNMIKITKPGGIILISTPNVLHPYSRLKFLLRGTLWHFDPEAFWETGHSTPQLLWLLRAHLESLGVEGIEHGYRGSFEMRGVRKAIVAGLNVMARRENCELGARDGCTTLIVVARTAGRAER